MIISTCFELFGFEWKQTKVIIPDVRSTLDLWHNQWWSIVNYRLINARKQSETVTSFCFEKFKCKLLFECEHLLSNILAGWAKCGPFCFKAYIQQTMEASEPIRMAKSYLSLPLLLLVQDAYRSEKTIFFRSDESFPTLIELSIFDQFHSQCQLTPPNFSTQISIQFRHRPNDTAIACTGAYRYRLPYVTHSMPAFWPTQEPASRFSTHCD